MILGNDKLTLKCSFDIRIPEHELLEEALNKLEFMTLEIIHQLASKFNQDVIIKFQPMKRTVENSELN